MRLIYKLLLTADAVAWMWVVYVINEDISFLHLKSWAFGIILIVATVMLGLLMVWLTKKLGNESDVTSCKECSLADGEFLPVYLGYFFVALSVSNIITMVAVFIIVFIFTFLSGTQYFNPIFLLFGYHYYHVLTDNGTKIFVIRRGRIIRNPKDIELVSLKRINDTTFIERR